MTEQVHVSEIVYTTADRRQYLVVLGASALALALGRWLQPAARGFGTHEQLGLPPCLFFKLTGIPCPNCGLTTSFAHASRLDFSQALLAQPFGLIVFSLAVISIPLLLYLMKARLPWSQVSGRRWSKRAFYALAVCYLLAWIYKIAALQGG